MTDAPAIAEGPPPGKQPRSNISVEIVSSRNAVPPPPVELSTRGRCAGARSGAPVWYVIFNASPSPG